MNKIVYVVTKGFYEDITIDRVFLDKAKAEKYLKANEVYQILANGHNWDLNFTKQVNNGLHPLGMEITEAMYDDSITV